MRLGIWGISFIILIAALIIGILGITALNEVYQVKVNESINSCNTCFTAYGVNDKCNLTWKPCGNNNESVCMKVPDACIEFGDEHCHESCPFLVALSDSWVDN